MGLRGPFTPEEARRYGAEGAKRSAEVRRQHKAMGEMLRAWLRQKSDSDPKKSNYDVMVTAVGAKALNGDVKAAEFIRDTIGEKPSTQVNVGGTLSEVKIFEIPDNGRG